jgi:hypothetical protein
MPPFIHKSMADQASIPCFHPEPGFRAFLPKIMNIPTFQDAAVQATRGDESCAKRAGRLVRHVREQAAQCLQEVRIDALLWQQDANGLLMLVMATHHPSRIRPIPEIGVFRKRFCVEFAHVERL